MSRYWVEGPVEPIRWPAEPGPDHPYWSRGREDASSGLGVYHVRAVTAAGGVWTRGRIGDCPPGRGCPQCLVAAEARAQEARRRGERGGVGIGDRSGRAEVVALVPKFGAAAALAVVESGEGEVVAHLGAYGTDRRGRVLAETLVSLVDGHRAAALAVSVVSASAPPGEIDEYRSAVSAAMKGADRSSVPVGVWGLAEMTSGSGVRVGRQDAVRAFSDRYAGGRVRLRARPEVRELLEHELGEYRAGRRMTIDDEAGVASDALLIAAGIGLCRIDDPTPPPQAYAPPVGQSITDYAGPSTDLF